MTREPRRGMALLVTLTLATVLLVMHARNVFAAVLAAIVFTLWVAEAGVQGTRVARLLIRVGTCLLPWDTRAHWRTVYLADLTADEPGSQSPVSFALDVLSGIPRQAIALRRSQSRVYVLDAFRGADLSWRRRLFLTALCAAAASGLGIAMRVGLQSGLYVAAGAAAVGLSLPEMDSSSLGRRASVLRDALAVCVVVAGSSLVLTVLTPFSFDLGRAICLASAVAVAALTVTSALHASVFLAGAAVATVTFDFFSVPGIRWFADDFVTTSNIGLLDYRQVEHQVVVAVTMLALSIHIGTLQFLARGLSAPNSRVWTYGLIILITFFQPVVLPIYFLSAGVRSIAAVLWTVSFLFVGIFIKLCLTTYRVGAAAGFHAMRHTVPPRVARSEARCGRHRMQSRLLVKWGLVDPPGHQMSQADGTNDPRTGVVRRIATYLGLAEDTTPRTVPYPRGAQ